MVQTHDLLGGFAGASPEYISNVAHTKRLLERFSGDPVFRASLHCDPELALEEAGLARVLSPDDLSALMNCSARGRTIASILQGETVNGDDFPACAAQYCAYVAEKLRMREAIRRDSTPQDPRLAVWRERQVNRCLMQFGAIRSAAVVHSPLAIELDKGCSVGCWFCGFAAPPLSDVFEYTPSNARLWKECLGVLRAKLGPAASQGVLYWATEPFDNPDYERFMTDFWVVTGRWPQTTTAAATRDIGRTRRFLALAREHGSEVDRFSILSVGQLRKVHEAFTPEEMISVECLLQNRESGTAKARSGRAATVAGSRASLVVPEQAGGASSIACVSGFLLNMVDRTVQMVAPCAADENWPLGYWVIDEHHFDGASSLDRALTEMIDRHAKPELLPDYPLRLRSDVRIEPIESSEALSVVTNTTKNTIACRGFDSDLLLESVFTGENTLRSVAKSVHRESDLLGVTRVLRRMYRQGMFDEDPARVV